MLVLTRRKRESIVIQVGEESVEVKVLQIKGSQVHLGVDAPREIPVHRKEVAEREEMSHGDA